ncbi:putative chaperonin Cpn60/TCP-1 family, groEL-like equatorial domain superfamily [Helianthus debilis subsp. tardiflorus]
MCTLLVILFIITFLYAIEGPNDHTIAQIKAAVRDGLRAVKNTIEDEAFVRGVGAFEVAARQHLVNVVKKTTKGVGLTLYIPCINIFQVLIHITHTHTEGGVWLQG